MEDYTAALRENRPGFDFTNFRRNQWLLTGEGKELKEFTASVKSLQSASSKAAGETLPLDKTGTTICALVCGKEGVIVAADSRASVGSLISVSEMMKLQPVCDNICLAGAGVAADFQHLCYWASKQAELHRLNTNTIPRVRHINSLLAKELFQYQGYKQCSIISGGFDIYGPSVYSISHDGFCRPCMFISVGSGSLNALTVLETNFREDLTVEEGLKLAEKAILAGITNDLGSGGTINAAVITKGGLKMKERILEPLVSLIPRKPQIGTFEEGTTRYFRQKVHDLQKHIVIETLHDENTALEVVGS